MCYIKRIEVCLIHYPVIALAANIGLIVKLSKRGGDIDEVEQDQLRNWEIAKNIHCNAPSNLTLFVPQMSGSPLLMSSPSKTQRYLLKDMLNTKTTYPRNKVSSKFESLFEDH